MAQNGNFKPLTLNNFDVCYFAFWLVQDFLIENFLFTILNMFFTMFSCTFNKKIPKSVNLASFGPKQGILNLWLWIILMFVILLFGWYKTSFVENFLFTFSICSLQCFHVHLIKIISKISKFGPFLAQNGNFKPLTLNNFDVCYFAFWLVQDFLIENFLFTILNMFFTMFSCTFNKKIPKSVNLAPFWPKTGILNLWLWIILMFVILLFGWYKTSSLLKISYLHSQYVLYNVFMYI